MGKQKHNPGIRKRIERKRAEQEQAEAHSMEALAQRLVRAGLASKMILSRRGGRA